jgi:hypothetical protein
MWFVELIKALAWPAVVVSTWWYFRPQIKVILARVIELSPTGGLKLGPPPPQDAIPPPGAPRGGDVSDVGFPPPDGPLLKGLDPSPKKGGGIIENIKRTIPPDQLNPTIDLIRRQLQAAANDDKDLQIEILVNATASFYVQVWYERNYIMMVGSQLRLLFRMDGPIAEETAKSIYDEAVRAYPDAYRAFSFEQWVGFPLRAGLCVRDASGKYSLTPFGRGFLQYMTERALPWSTKVL